MKILRELKARKAKFGFEAQGALPDPVMLRTLAECLEEANWMDPDNTVDEVTQGGMRTYWKIYTNNELLAESLRQKYC